MDRAQHFLQNDLITKPSYMICVQLRSVKIWSYSLFRSHSSIKLTHCKSFRRIYSNSNLIIYFSNSCSSLIKVKWWNPEQWKHHSYLGLGRFSGETKPEWEERVVMPIPNIHWELFNSPEPSPGKFPSEAIVAKQNICNTLAFCSWEPSSNKGINLINIWLNNQRTTRDDDDNTLHSSTDVCDDAWPRVRDCQIQVVTKCLCIWGFSHHNNGIGEFAGLDIAKIRVLFIDDFGFWINCLLYGAEDRGTCSWRDSGFISHQNDPRDENVPTFKRMRSSVTIPLVRLLPLSPCHSIVHPPHWLPRLSAWVPATSIFGAFLGRGSNGLSAGSPFFRRTSDFLTASLANSLCTCSKL